MICIFITIIFCVPEKIKEAGMRRGLCTLQDPDDFAAWSGKETKIILDSAFHDAIIMLDNGSFHKSD